MKLSTICCIIYLFIYCGNLYAQHTSKLYFKTLDIYNGLSHNSVLAIMQDRQGFIWFGTKDGLNRYDGIKFKIFKKENSTLGNNYITTLTEDSQGNIWIGTDVGVYIYNTETETFSPFRVTTPQKESIRSTITQISIEEGGDVWIAADFQGLFCYVNGNLAVSNIRKLECSSFDFHSIAYGYGTFKEKIHFTEYYP